MGLLGAIQDEQFWRDVAKNGRGLLQGASNAAATNMTGPVDAINMGLGLLGLPVSREPLGGDAWAKRMGLVAPASGPAAMAGETLGLIAPVLGTARAPQIASGLLKMADNAMAPRTMNSQTGAIVWHGSPHKFDKFDASKIGTGEGAQAYGHGLYFAESPDTASFYKAALTDRFPAKLDGKQAAELSTAQKSALGILNDYGGNVDGALAFAKRDMAKAGNAGADFHAERYNTLFDIKRGRSTADVASPSLYKVDLPDQAIAKMLDWDKPLSQQAPEVQAIAQSLMKNGQQNQFGWLVNQGDPDGMAMSGKQFLNSLQGGEFQMQKAGIPGIRYLDGGSRGAGAGSSNFVVFPGEESLLSILERNGKALP